MKTQDIEKLMREWEEKRKPAIPKQYAQIKGKNFEMLKAELMDVYNRYPDYNDPEYGGNGFNAMVNLFASDDFYHEHYVAKEYLKIKLQNNKKNY
jgi:hypothetical protein